MDSSNKDFFANPNWWTDEEADEKIDKYKPLYSADTKKEIEEAGKKAGRLIEEAGRNAALAVNDPDEFASAYRKFRRVIEKCLTDWILCGYFGVPAVRLFPQVSNSDEKKSHEYMYKTLSEVISNISVFAYNDEFMLGIIKAYGKSNTDNDGKEFTGYLYSSLKKKAKDQFRLENIENKLNGRTDTESRINFINRLIKVADSLNVDLLSADDEKLETIAEKLSTKAWNVSLDYVKKAVVQFYNMSAVSIDAFNENIGNCEDGTAEYINEAYSGQSFGETDDGNSAGSDEFSGLSNDGNDDIFDNIVSYDETDDRYVAEKSAIVREASASLTEKQNKVFVAVNTLRLLEYDINEILSRARKDFHKSRMSVKELFEDHFDDRILQEIRDRFCVHSQSGCLSLDYEVFSFMLKSRRLPAEKEIAALYGIKPDDFTNTYKAALKKINAFKNR